MARRIGWFLVAGGLGWLTLGIYSNADAFRMLTRAETEIVRRVAAEVVGVAVLVYVIPGVVAAWIGAGVLKHRRVPCPNCAEPIKRAAKVCRFCGKSIAAV